MTRRYREMTIRDLLGEKLAQDALQQSHFAWAPEGFVPPEHPVESGMPGWKGLYVLRMEHRTVIAELADAPDDSFSSVQRRIAQARVEQRNRRLD
jgi:hypothetical protein